MGRIGVLRDHKVTSCLGRLVWLPFMRKQFRLMQRNVAGHVELLRRLLRVRLRLNDLVQERILNVLATRLVRRPNRVLVMLLRLSVVHAEISVSHDRLLVLAHFGAWRV